MVVSRITQGSHKGGILSVLTLTDLADDPNVGRYFNSVSFSLSGYSMTLLFANDARLCKLLAYSFCLSY